MRKKLFFWGEIILSALPETTVKTLEFSSPLKLSLPKECSLYKWTVSGMCWRTDSRWRMLERHFMPCQASSVVSFSLPQCARGIS